MLETICDIMRESYARGWITSRDGNVSIRHHDRDHFYITPSGVRKQTLQPDQFKKIRLTTTINAAPPFLTPGWEVAEYTAISAALQPSGELPLHFGLQRALGQHCGDTRVVVHVHPTYTVAAMHAGIQLADLARDFPELSRYTCVAPNTPAVAPLSQDLADACFRSLELTPTGHCAYHAVGIPGHGVVAIDTSPWRALEHVERLEHICRIVLASGRITC